MNIHTWIENQWGQARLGDARRNARAIKLAVILLPFSGGKELVKV